MKDDQILDSWKEISEYLGRSRKTCLRWEKELSLPIHRYEESPKARVFAYKSEIDLWREKTLKGEDSPQKLFPFISRRVASSLKTKILFVAVLLGVFLIISIAVWKLFPQKEGDITPNTKKSLAVISFENRTGNNAYDHLQKVIPDLLITNLENTGYFYVATWERMRDLLKQMGKSDLEYVDRDLGFELCRREGIRALVLGSLNKAGDLFVTDVKVYDVETKKSIKSASSKGVGEQSILETQIDELSREISKGMGLAQDKIESAKLQINEVTTSSMEAYSYFLGGRELEEKLYQENARQFYEKAIDLDPTFASAYNRLALIYAIQNNQKASVEAIEKAKAFSQNVSDKERLFIDANYARLKENDHDKRLNILKKLAERYPKEKHVYYKMGRYYNSRDPDKAKEAWGKALKLDPNYPPALNQIGLIYLIQEKNFEKALEYFEKYASVSPGEANPIDSIAAVYWNMGRLDKAIAKYKEALSVKPDYLMSIHQMQYIYAFKEEYEKAIELIEKYTSMSPLSMKYRGYVWKGFYDYWLGKLESSLVNLQKAEELAESFESNVGKALASWMKAWIYYDTGELEQSRKYVGKIKAYEMGNFFILGFIELKENQVDLSRSRLAELKPGTFLHDYLQAEILFTEGIYKKAIALFENASHFDIPNLEYTKQILAYNIPFTKDVLARVYKYNGELDKAITEYERLITFDPRSKDRCLIHPKYYYRLAKLYEENGQNRKAIEHYEKFLDLWKYADQGIAEVEDARERVVGVKNLP